jgi:hypothetical protein
MKTNQLLEMPEAQLVPLLREMKIKELEKHSEKILARLGQKNYNEIIGGLIRLLPQIEKEGDKRYSLVKGFLTENINTEEGGAVVDRLCVVMVLLISKKFLSIHNAKSG